MHNTLGKSSHIATKIHFIFIHIFLKDLASITACNHTAAMWVASGQTDFYKGTNFSSVCKFLKNKSVITQAPIKYKHNFI